MAYKPNNRWKTKYKNADSKWEGELREGLLKDWEHHPDKISYKVEHTYEPDFKKGNTLIEAKGRFMDSTEASKYTWVRKVLPEDTELVFLFYKASAPMPNAKRRKDGTKQTHAEWATRNKFRWFTEDTIHQLQEDK
jgi:hypothetical protein